MAVQKETENNAQKNFRTYNLLIFLMAFLYIIATSTTIYNLNINLQSTAKSITDMELVLIKLNDEIKLLKAKPEKLTIENIRQRREASEEKSVYDTGSFSEMIDSDENLEQSTHKVHGSPLRRKHNERRGKNKRKKNRRKRVHGKSIPRASHFVGAMPDALIRDGGSLAPWLVANEAIKDFGIVTNVPNGRRESIEIAENGLYFIYAQVYYMGDINEKNKTHHSFMIMVKPINNVEMQLAQCSTVGDDGSKGEVSCFTGAAHTLMEGDMLYIKQRERERKVVMKPGKTFLGLVLLNKWNK